MEIYKKVHLLFIDDIATYQQRVSRGFIDTGAYKSSKCYEAFKVNELKSFIQEEVSYSGEDKILALIHTNQTDPDWVEVLKVRLNTIKKSLPKLTLAIITKTKVDEVSQLFRNDRVIGYDYILDFIDDNFLSIRSKSQILEDSNGKKNNDQKDAIYVFLSHSTADKMLAEKFMDEILIRGLMLNKEKNIFFSGHTATGISFGNDINDELKVALKKMTHFIHFSSEFYFKSPYCICELGAAWVLLEKKQVLNIYIRDKGYQSRSVKTVVSDNRHIEITNLEDLEGLYAKFFMDDFRKYGHTVGLADFPLAVRNLISFGTRELSKRSRNFKPRKKKT